ncbi:carboxymuconolactone decarboxylase family protein [Jiangella aurantiaca]|uniref:Carboxymuconolactone decarboxylase family protein n=1 Tax=Jiangella aurantiaca TaxID=2530373 RepID=A0A4R5AEZ2_9ACTN|nr:carboxymuconolactone decarboxylase family protein [Jiangella aurantiaca]TDD68502.1 carboxymuconolactone decarboxylase family protein [Jiangella aurantiaca]
MTRRLNVPATTPEGYRAVYGLSEYIKANVDHTLMRLIELRASIINGCSFCVDMHSRDALADGEDSRRLFAVGAWEDAPFFDERERAALALTDAVTRLADDGGVPDDVWDAAEKHFTERELADVLLTIATINVWNRINVPTRTPAPATV